MIEMPKLFAVVAICALAVVGQPVAAQIRPNVGALRNQTQSAVQAAKPHRSAAQGTSSSVGGLVDWSYVRMNSPALFSSLVHRVQTGEAPPRSLAGAVRAENLHFLLDSSAGAPTATSSPSRLAAALPRAPKGPANLEAKAGSNAALNALIPLDVSPKAVNFGAVVDKQSVRQVIYVTTLTAGPVAVTLAAGTPFKIINVKALDGLLLFKNKNRLAGSLIDTGAAELPNPLGVASAKIADAAALNARASAPIGKSSGARTMLQSSTALRPVSVFNTEATSAPFSVFGKEGQRIRIVVEFKPHFDLFSGDYVGVHNTELHIESEKRSATVPLRGKFDGVNIGVIVIPQDRELTLLASSKTMTHPSGGNQVLSVQHLSVSSQLTIANPGPPCNIDLWPQDLPQGVTMGDRTLKVPSGQSTNTVWFDVMFRGDDRGAQFGMGQELVFTITTPQRHWDVSLTLNILPDIREFHWQGGLDDVAYDVKALASSEGRIDIDYAFNTTNAWPTDAVFTISIGGVECARCKDIRVPTHSDVNLHPQTVKPSFQCDQLRDNWERLVLLPGSYWLHVSEHI